MDSLNSLRDPCVRAAEAILGTKASSWDIGQAARKIADCVQQSQGYAAEAEAWKTAQLAATIMGTTWFYESVGAEGAVEQARAILAEARRQTTPETTNDQ